MITATVLWLVITSADIRGGPPTVEIAPSKTICMARQNVVQEWNRKRWCVPLIQEVPK